MVSISHSEALQCCSTNGTLGPKFDVNVVQCHTMLCWSRLTLQHGEPANAKLDMYGPMSTVTVATIQAQLAKMIDQSDQTAPMVQVSHGVHFTSWIHQYSMPANRNLLYLEYRDLLNTTYLYGMASH